MNAASFLDIKIVHPCQLWAQAAGFKSWQEVIEHCQTKIATGTTHSISSGSYKTNINATMFMKEVHAQGFHVFCDDFGFMSIGKLENFPPQVKIMIEEGIEETRKWLQRYVAYDAEQQTTDPAAAPQTN